MVQRVDLVFRDGQEAHLSPCSSTVPKPLRVVPRLVVAAGALAESAGSRSGAGHGSRVAAYAGRAAAGEEAASAGECPAVRRTRGHRRAASRSPTTTAMRRIASCSGRAISRTRPSEAGARHLQSRDARRPRVGRAPDRRVRTACRLGAGRHRLRRRHASHQFRGPGLRSSRISPAARG